MSEYREKEFRELHTKLLTQVGLEFKKHGFAPMPIQIKYNSVLDLTTQEIYHI
ncbi:MAG: hypothetical protein K6A44_01650 [bacterium]|nr:hypothetical protein [bacterium]